MRTIYAVVACSIMTSVSFAQNQALPRLGAPAGPTFQIQKNGLPAGFGTNAFNGLNNNNGVNNPNAFNNRGFNPIVSPYMNGYGGWNPYTGGYGAYNPYFNPYNSGFANPGYGFYPQTPNVWSSYNLTPWTPGVSPYGGLPYGQPYGPYGPGYQLPQWYNGVSPAPIVGISGPPFGPFPGVQ